MATHWRRSSFTNLFSLRHCSSYPCARVKWVPFVLLAFFPLFYSSIFASKLAIFPLKRSVLGAWKGHFRARKGQMVDLGFQDPKPPEMPYKTRENVTTPQLASLHGLASNWAKNCYKTGEKNAKRTNGTYFARPHPTLPLRTQGIFWGSFSSRAQNAIPERASPEGTRVAARRGLLMLRHESRPEFYRTLARILLRILSQHRHKFFGLFALAPKIKRVSAESAVSCAFLRKSAVSCGFLRLQNGVIPRKAKICKNLRKSAKKGIWLRLSLLVCPVSFIPLDEIPRQRGRNPRQFWKKEFPVLALSARAWFASLLLDANISMLNKEVL